MAKIGFKRLVWAKMLTEPEDAIPTYEAGKVMGKAVSSNLAITNAEGELYADDALAEYIKEFSSAKLTAAVDNIPLENQAQMYGSRYQDGELQHWADDNPPYAGVGGHQVLLIQNVRKYRAWVFPKTKASVPDEDDTTKGNSISFGTQPIDMTIMRPEFGPWKRVKEFETEAGAKAYVDTLLNVAVWHNIAVQVQGNGGSTFEGRTSVPDNGEYVLVLEGAPTKLYDNGVDKTSDIASGKYTLASVTAENRIAVIF